MDFDNFLSELFFDFDYFNRINKEFTKNLYRVFREENNPYDMMYHPVKTIKDIYQIYYEIDPYYIDLEDIESSFEKESKLKKYYNITAIVNSQLNIEEDDLHNWFITSPEELINPVLAEIHNLNIEPKKLKATDYVKLISFLHKNYPELINEKLNINNIRNIILKYIYELNSKESKEKALLYLSNLLKANIFNIIRNTHYEDKYFSKILNKIKNITENNIKKIVNEIENIIASKMYIPSYDEISYENSDFYGEFTFNLVVPVGENAIDIYKKEILNKSKNNEIIYLDHTPYLEWRKN